jgi:hypothetical protein
MNDIQKVMLELLAMERYWEFQENINFEHCNWDYVHAFLNEFTDSVRYITKGKETYFNNACEDEEEKDNLKVIYNQGYVNGVRFAINSLLHRFNDIDNLELPKELIDSETSDVLYNINLFLNYIETEQLIKDVEEK